MIDQNTKELMANALFAVDDFEQVWYEVDQLHDALKLREYGDDAEKIAEYKYVTQQLRKYMASKKETVLGCDSLEDMVSAVEMLIMKQREYGDTRQDLLYNFMRDHWLMRVHNILSQMAASGVDEEDE